MCRWLFGLRLAGGGLDGDGVRWGATYARVCGRGRADMLVSCFWGACRMSIGSEMDARGHRRKAGADIRSGTAAWGTDPELWRGQSSRSSA